MLFAVTMVGFEAAKAKSLLPLPPPIWLLIFGFLKHDAMPTYASDASYDTDSDDDEFGDQFRDQYGDEFGDEFDDEFDDRFDDEFRVEQLDNPFKCWALFWIEGQGRASFRAGTTQSDPAAGRV